MTAGKGLLEAPRESAVGALALHRLLTQIRTSEEQLTYVLIDGARDHGLAQAPKTLLNEPVLSLFVRPSVHMRKVAPYFAPIRCHCRYPEYLDLLGGRLWDNAGILLISRAWPQAMRDHLRDIFRVQDEAGKKFYFRYYDPRVLRTYLPTCTKDEIKKFLGPIEMLLLPDRRPGRIWRLQLTYNGIETTRYTLEQDGHWQSENHLQSAMGR